MRKINFTVTYAVHLSFETNETDEEVLEETMLSMSDNALVSSTVKPELNYSALEDKNAIVSCLSSYIVNNMTTHDLMDQATASIETWLDTLSDDELKEKLNEYGLTL